MYDNKNNKNNIQSNQIDVIQDVTQDVNIEKLTGATLSNFINEHNFSGFTIMSNSTINLLKYDCALGVYCYLASKPNNWIISVENIKSHFDISKEKAYKIVNHLIEVGLLERKDFRENGKHKKTIYYLYISPKKQDPEFQETEFQEAEKPPTTKKRIKQINNINNNISCSNTKKSYSDEFESFWSQSNKRGEKVKAYAAWKSHKLDNQLDLMIDLLQSNYSLKFGDREVRYQPHISTWINYRPWEEGAVKTEEEIIAKAHEQLQATKDNLPAQINDTKPISSDLERFKQQSLRFGLTIKDNLIEAFLEALKSRNISIYQSNLEIIIEELQKMKFEGLDVNDCIKKFLLSSWKSFSIDYFQKKKAKRESLSNPFALHNQLKNKEK